MTQKLFDMTLVAEEGGICLDTDCEGRLEYPPVENCSCHINPPCGACENNKLVCSSCGWEEEDD